MGGYCNTIILVPETLNDTVELRTLGTRDRRRDRELGYVEKKVNSRMFSFKLKSQAAISESEVPVSSERAARSAFMAGLPLAPQITVTKCENNINWSRTHLNLKFFSYDRVDLTCRHLRVKVTINKYEINMKN